MRKTLVLSLMFCVSHLAGSAQSLISSTLIATYTKQQIDSIYAANGLPAFLLPVRHDIEIYQLVYETVSYDSSTTFASGAIIIPVGTTCKIPMVSYQHGTIQKASDAPSFNNGEIIIGIALAADGYAVSMPDYLGLGITNLPLHPYIHAQSEATASVDMLIASRNFMAGMGKEHNGQLFLAGYSQGGHATMALHRLIEAELSQDIQVTASAPMSGPYDVSETQAQVITNDSVYSQPAFLPFVMFGLNQVYSFFGNPSNVLDTPYDFTIPPVMNGNFTTGDVNNIMPAIPNEIINPAVLDSFRTEPNHYFRVALRDNDVYNWLPVSPIRMFYCEADEQVYYMNAFVAYNQFIQNGATNVTKVSAGATLDHGGCARIALILGKVWFDSLRTDKITAAFNIVQESAPGSANGSITANVSGGLQPLSLNWSNGATGNTITGLTGGTYILTITTADSCIVTDTVFVPTVTGMEDLTLTEEQVIIQPNPFHDIAEVKFANPSVAGKITEVWLEDLSGRKVQTFDSKEGNKIIIRRNGLSNGIYLLRMRSQGKEVGKKLLLY
jgi:hypothetical protein